MTRYRSPRSRPALCCALLAASVLTGCGIHVESIAQTPLFVVAPHTPAASPASESSALTPCVPGAGRPHAAAVVSDLLLGKDRYATDCTRQARPVVQPAPLGVPARTAPVTPPATGMVSDELVGAVLTGASEYWYQPVIGPV
ncbi:hypothetical protein V4U86_08235 [Mycobacterium sp. AMU20-3851]|uniref:hypothetical protein n=1 Tax=Mycobacterium sp. AMU20-3851 TaxID=3122055 RepID=UPI0037548EF7